MGGTGIEPVTPCMSSSSEQNPTISRYNDNSNIIAGNTQETDDEVDGV